jgi:hypothetical protein
LTLIRTIARYGRTVVWSLNAIRSIAVPRDVPGITVLVGVLASTSGARELDGSG